MAAEVESLKASLRERYEVGAIVGQAPSMRDIFKDVGRVAGTDVTVLITGESGTGKELIARAIHAHSKRVAGPFIVVNSAAIPRELMESELFGHEKGVVHRGLLEEDRQVRAGGRRDAVPGRDRRHGPEPPGEAPSCVPGEGVRARGRVLRR